MKRSIRAAALAAILIAAATLGVTRLYATLSANDSIKGSGTPATKEIPVPEFNAVNASRAVKVDLTQQGSRIRIEADEKLIDRVVVESVDGELRITIDPELRNIRNLEARVTVPVGQREIRTLKASSAARITGPETTLETSHLLVKASSAARIEAAVHGQSCSVDASSAAHVELGIQAPKCQLEASSAARITADSLDAESCTARVTSAAGIRIKGQTTYFEAEATSAGRIEAEELTATRASVRATSGSGIELECTGQLEAKASSGASIRYSGDCQTEATKSSGGSIRKI